MNEAVQSLGLSQIRWRAWLLTPWTVVIAAPLSSSCCSIRPI